MAAERPAEAAEGRPALELEAGGEIERERIHAFVRVKIDSPWLAAGMVGLGIATLATLHWGSVENAVKLALAGLADRVLSIRPSSVLVDVWFNTKEKFLEFMDALVTGTVKQRFQDEFAKIGFKGELQVAVTVYDNASQMR